jgi:hypothetical protein
MNKRSSFISVLLLVLCVLGCDSPPWSRCIIANGSPKDMVIRFYTPYPLFGAPCVYSPSEWASDPGGCSKRFRQGFTINEEEKWFEVTIPTGGAVEITRYRYPDIEENPGGQFSYRSIRHTWVVWGHIVERSYTDIQSFSKGRRRPAMVCLGQVTAICSLL